MRSVCAAKSSARTLLFLFAFFTSEQVPDRREQNAWLCFQPERKGDPLPAVGVKIGGLGMQTGEAVRKRGCQIAVLAVHDPETVPGWKEGIQLSHVFHKCHGRETHEAVFIAPVELVLEIEGSAGKKYGRLASHIHVRKEKGIPLLPLVGDGCFPAVIFRGGHGVMADSRVFQAQGQK